MSQFNIKFYTDSDGKCDFFNYYQKLKLEKESGNKNSRILFLAISRKLRILKRNGTEIECQILDTLRAVIFRFGKLELNIQRDILEFLFTGEIIFIMY